MYHLRLAWPIWSLINTSQCIEFNLSTIEFDLKWLQGVGNLKNNFTGRRSQNQWQLFPDQSDTKAWDDDDLGSTSPITFFSSGCLITWWNHLIVWTIIDLGNTIFSNWVEQDLSYTRWCHQHYHLVVSWPSCLNYLLVEQAVVCPAAAIHECKRNSMDFWSKCEVSGKLR